MALFEYQCDSCRTRFEEILRSGDSKTISCPKCKSAEVSRLISKFAVGGRGDLRETTQHGCHDGFSGLEGHGHDHDHDHGTGSEE